MQLLTRSEREQIEFSLRIKRSVPTIARLLSRHRTTIQREVSRNTVPGSRYRAAVAQRLADQRARKTNQRKLDADPTLRTYVCSQLQAHWNPKVIAGRLREYQESIPLCVRGTTISHEAIYQWVYEGSGRFGGWYQHLPRQHRHRRRRCGRRKRGIHAEIPGRVSIHERSGAADARTEPGHWETDSVQFTKQSEGLSVQTERMFRLCRITRIPNRTAPETRRVLAERLGGEPDWLRKTLTMDNGPEHTDHRELREPLGIQTYHCDPYASWQRGSTEHMNGLIRRFLPRKTKLATVSDDELTRIEDHLNHLPRAILHYRSPQEAFLTYQFRGALNY